MTEPADPGVHAAIEVVARERQSRMRVRSALSSPQGVTCRQYICLGGYCDSGPAGGQDPAGVSGEGRVRTRPALAGPR